jgi:hypothetical protein
MTASEYPIGDVRILLPPWWHEESQQTRVIEFIGRGVVTHHIGNIAMFQLDDGVNEVAESFCYLAPPEQWEEFRSEIESEAGYHFEQITASEFLRRLDEEARE